MFFSFYDLALLAVIIFTGFGSLPAVQSAAILVFSHLFSSLILLVFSTCRQRQNLICFCFCVFYFYFF